MGKYTKWQQRIPKCYKGLLKYAIILGLVYLATLDYGGMHLESLQIKITDWKASVAGLPDLSWYKIPKRGKIYQITPKYYKWLKNRPNGRKIDQMSIKYTNILHCKTLHNVPKFRFLV
jgi:hypothetical protein